ncbi:MAG: hypothetical protein WCF23_09940 [Candidatus Nitrosopolaris sp.]
MTKNNTAAVYKIDDEIMSLYRLQHIISVSLLPEMILFYAFRMAKQRRLVIDYHCALKIIEGIS